MPNAKNRVVENAYGRSRTPCRAFTNRPYDDPELLEAARRIEEDPMPRGSMRAAERRRVAEHARP